LVEILLAGAVLALLVTVIGGTFIYGWESSRLLGNRTKAVLLAEEGLAVARNIRDEDFANLADGTYGLVFSNGQWEFSGSQDDIDIFTRETTVTSIDDNRKQISTRVNWDQNLQRTGEVLLVSYLTYWQKVVEKFGDWTNPTMQSVLGLAGNQNGRKVQVQGNYAYMVRLGGDPDFVVVDISDPATPVLVGALNLPDNPTNIAVNGNYAYISSESNSEELQIVNISNPSSPSLIGTYNLAGNDNANGIYFADDKVYLVTDQDNKNGEFFIINVNNPSSPVLLGEEELGSNAQEVVVLDDYAFVASDSNSEELQVIDISSSSSPNKVGGYDANGNSAGLSIVGFAQTVVLGRSGGEVLILDISSADNPELRGTFDAKDDVNDLALGNDNDYVFIACNEGGEEFQAIDISDKDNPDLLGSFNAPNNLNGVAYTAESDRVIAVGNDNNSEMIIIQP